MFFKTQLLPISIQLYATCRYHNHRAIHAITSMALWNYSQHRTTSASKFQNAISPTFFLASDPNVTMVYNNRKKKNICSVTSIATEHCNDKVGVYIYPPIGLNHQSYLIQITTHKKRIVLSPTYRPITIVWTAIFTLHSGHVENVSRARYIVSHQLRIFYRAHNGARKIYVPSISCHVVPCFQIGIKSKVTFCLNILAYLLFRSSTASSPPGFSSSLGAHKLPWENTDFAWHYQPHGTEDSALLFGTNPNFFHQPKDLAER